MNRSSGNIWNFYNLDYIAIPTNGTVTKANRLVMGAGVARQAKQIFPNIDLEFGRRVKEYGNQVHYLHSPRVLSFPVKNNYWDKADSELIKLSCNQAMIARPANARVYLPLVGCGNGGLRKEDVLPILDKYLDDNFTLITLGEM